MQVLSISKQVASEIHNIAWVTKNATLLRFDSRTPRKIDGIMLPRKNLACTEILTWYSFL